MPKQIRDGEWPFPLPVSYYVDGGLIIITDANGKGRFAFSGVERFAVAEFVLDSINRRVGTTNIEGAARRLIQAWDSEPHANFDAECEYAEEQLREAIAASSAFTPNVTPMVWKMECRSDQGEWYKFDYTEDKERAERWSKYENCRVIPLIPIGAPPDGKED